MPKETKQAFDDRFTREMTEAADSMRRAGVIDDAAHAKIRGELAPSRRTVTAMKAARRGELVAVSSPDALLKSLNADD
jgi:hypothetical protein